MADESLKVARMAPADHLNWLRAESESFGQVLATGDLDAPVPSCPGWTLTDLTAHLGAVHRWARAAILTGPGPGEFPAPSGRPALADWFAEGAGKLQETLHASDPDADCWTFGDPRSVGFWMRRQAHENAIHRWDAQASQGTPEPLDPALATDGVDEVVDMFFPRQVRLERIPPLASSLRLNLPGASRTLAGDGTGPDPDTIDAEIAGPAEALLLLLWRRTDLDDPRLQLTGSRTAAAEVLAAGLTP